MEEGMVTVFYRMVIMMLMISSMVIGIDMAKAMIIVDFMNT